MIFQTSIGQFNLKWPHQGYSNTYPISDTTGKLFSNIAGILTLIAGLSFIFYGFIAVLGWLTSGGDQQRIKKSRQSVTQAVIGLAITVSAYPIAFVVSKLLGIHSMSPADFFQSLIY